MPRPLPREDKPNHARLFAPDSLFCTIVRYDMQMHDVLLMMVGSKMLSVEGIRYPHQCIGLFGDFWSLPSLHNPIAPFQVVPDCIKYYWKEHWRK